jgi:hypothetical protein
MLRGHYPGLESLKSLAAVFEVEIYDLKMEADMSKEVKITAEEQQAILYVRDIKGFYTHLIIYIVVIGFLFALNIIKSSNHIWAIWPAIGWGIGVTFHALNVFEVINLFGLDWEKRQIEKRLNHNL